MSRVILLDAGIIGLVTNPKLSAESFACTQWLQILVSSGSRVIIPEKTTNIEINFVTFTHIIFVKPNIILN